MPDRQPSSLLVTAAVGANLLFVAVMVSLPLPAFLAHTATDDAYYYFEIARRFGESPWPTFDGLHVTSGFHPLWLWVMVGLAQLVPDDPFLFARAAVALSSLLALGAALLLGRLVAADSGRRAGALATVVLVGSVGLARTGLLGMETSIALLALVLVVREAARERPRPLAFGALAGLLVLARLDMALVAAVLGLWRLRRLGPVGAVLAALAGLAVVGPWIVWTVATTGHVGTTSAASKALQASMDAAQLGGRATLDFAEAVLASLGHTAGELVRGLAANAGGAVALAGGDYPGAVSLGDVVPGALAGGALLAVGAFLLAPRALGLADGRSAAAPPFVWPLVIGVAVHALGVALAIPGHDGPWYWGPLVLVALLALATLPRRPLVQRLVGAYGLAGLASLVLVAGVAGCAALAGRMDDRRSFSRAMVEVAAAVDRIVPPGERVGSQNAGTLGHVAEHAIVNLDGLVNDWSFWEARRAGRIREWVRAADVRWFADCALPEHDAIRAADVGLSPEEVRPVVRIDGGTCRGFLWEIRWAPDAAAAVP